MAKILNIPDTHPYLFGVMPYIKNDGSKNIKYDGKPYSQKRGIDKEQPNFAYGHI